MAAIFIYLDVLIFQLHIDSDQYAKSLYLVVFVGFLQKYRFVLCRLVQVDD